MEAFEKQNSCKPDLVAGVFYWCFFSFIAIVYYAFNMEKAGANCRPSCCPTFANPKE